MGLNKHTFWANDVTNLLHNRTFQPQRSLSAVLYNWTMQMRFWWTSQSASMT